MSDINQMTSNVTNVAISLLCELQAGKEDRHEAATGEDEVESEYSNILPHRLTSWNRRSHTRTADFKRLLTACTKLVINEA